MAPKGTILPFARWRLDVRKNKEIVTVFAFSVLARAVKASVGPVVKIEDGPDAQYVRYPQVGIAVGKNSWTVSGGPWPYWMVVVRGDHAKAPYPRLPEKFDLWFDEWAAANTIEVIADWRAEARADDAGDCWIWKEVHAAAAAVAEMMGAAK